MQDDLFGNYAALASAKVGDAFRNAEAIGGPNVESASVSGTPGLAPSDPASDECTGAPGAMTNRDGAGSPDSMPSDNSPVPAVVDPTSADLPENARVRLAGDTVVGKIPPTTFAEAIAALAASGTLKETQLNSLRRDVAWIEARRPRHRDGTLPAALPCDPALLRPILAGFRPARHKISAKRWYNIKSSLAAVQRKTGWLPA
ncbi:MAG: hypothetical protein ACP5E6_17520, partial [Acidiphilium sp.]